MPSELTFDISEIRGLAKACVNESSLRAVADDIGISKSGLDHFLKGRSPYAATRAKLIAWSLRQHSAAGKAVRPEDVDAAIALLERYLSSAGTPSSRERRVREVSSRLFRAEQTARRRPT